MALLIIGSIIGTLGSAQAAPLRAVDGLVPLSGICEASGAALGHDGVAWIVDDDQEGKVFRWLPGTLDVLALPLPQLDGKAPIKDPEGVAVAGDQSLWITGSHALSKSGKLKRRSSVVRVDQKNDVINIQTAQRLRPKKGEDALRPLNAGLAAVCSRCTLQPSAASDREGEALNIEGMAIIEDGGPPGLYLGLRAPLIDHHALVFSLPPAALLEEASAAPVPVGSATLLDLGGRGVRALAPAKGGGMLIIGGPTKDGDKDRLGAVLYHWMPGGQPAILGTLPLGPSDAMPEALISTDVRTAWILYDEGDRLTSDNSVKAAHRDAKGEFSCGAGDAAGATDPWAHAQRIEW